MADEPHVEQQGAPGLAPGTDAELGDETRELLIRGEIDEALRRHDGSSRPRPAEDAERTSGELGGAGGDQEGGAG
ncbi:MAG: hypothetical protein ACJ74O_16170 [Frankiaceae bacterium]